MKELRVPVDWLEPPEEGSLRSRNLIRITIWVVGIEVALSLLIYGWDMASGLTTVGGWETDEWLSALGLVWIIPMVALLTQTYRHYHRTGAEAQRLRRESAARLAELVQARREIVTQVAHEIRTPLTIIHGSAASLAMHHNTMDADDRQELIESVRRATERLESLPDLLERIMQPDDSAELRRMAL